MGKKRGRKYMYGKFYHDTSEFHRDLHKLFDDFLREHRLEMQTHNDVVDLRNRVVALLDSWIGAKKLESKFGIKIPLSATPPSIRDFLEKQARSNRKIYKPCEICGEDRVTHYCHIIPRADGGPHSNENYVYLCPVHHHLFDHNRLYKNEWDKIDFTSKLPAAQEYANKMKLPMLQKLWEEDRT